MTNYCKIEAGITMDQAVALEARTLDVYDFCETHLIELRDENDSCFECEAEWQIGLDLYHSRLAGDIEDEEEPF